MKNTILVLAHLVCVLSCQQPPPSIKYTIFAGKGTGSIIIDMPAPDNVPSDVLVFENPEGHVEYIYTEHIRYKLKIEEIFISIGDDFEKIDSEIKISLQRDEGTSDKLVGDWYLSRRGYLISVLHGKIKGIGACKKT